MRIAYDLRFAGDHFTGIGTHAFLLLEALVRLAPAETFLVLWDPRQRQTRFDSRSIRDRVNVRWEERPIGPFQFDSPWRVGDWLRKSGADVYFSPFYIRPVGAPCPCVLTLHDAWPMRLPEGLSLPRRLLHRLLLHWARSTDIILTSSEFSRREIVALSPIPDLALRVVPLGIPPLVTSVEARPPAGAPARPFALGVSVNRPHKNLETIAKAWAKLGADHGLELVWVGREDPRYPGIGRLAESAGAHGVRAMGWVDQAGLEWLYANASMLLLPTRYEGFGLPLLEAARRGLPVIASDIPPLREVGEGAARFCDPDDPTVWAGAILEVAKDEGLRESLREKGRERAAQFTYERTARATLGVLLEAAAGGVSRKVAETTR